MRDRLQGIIRAIVIATSTAACGTSVPSPSPSPVGATSFDEYATASCSAWGTLFRVVGNPDTAAWTDTVHQLQGAGEARDDATAAGLQGRINTELEARAFRSPMQPAGHLRPDRWQRWTASSSPRR